jgi:uncharacterized repeat protein (TIGR01451 family)
MFKPNRPVVAALLCSILVIFSIACGGGAVGSPSPAPASNPAPSIGSLTPANTIVGNVGLGMTVSGSGFISSSIVKWNGSDRATTFVSSTQLTAAITQADIASAGTAQVTVTNPAPGGGVSIAAAFVINNPSAVVTSLAPSIATLGGSAFTLVVNGSGFVPLSTVRWNGTDHATTFVGGTQLTAAITQADLGSAGTAQVTVNNPAPGGGTSSAATFAINNPSPVVTGVSPSIITTSNAGTVLSITGAGFLPSTAITWNGSNRTTTFVSGTQLQTTILASDVGSVGAAQIGAVNPAPGGGAASAISVPIQYGSPSMTSLSPSAATFGGSAFTLVVNGSGFVPASIVRWNGADRVTTFVGSTTIKAAIGAAEIAAVGAANVSVYTPAPGGGTASTLTFSISAAPVPTVSTVFPSSSYVGAGDTAITVFGTGFVVASTIQWNGADLTTSFISGTQVRATVPSADLVSVGSNSIKVNNPSGGGLSNSISFSVLPNPTPTISVISPNSAPIGSANLTLTVNGSGFTNTSVVRWTGLSTTDLPTQYVNGSRLTATVPNTALQTFGTFSVNVFTPAPGGGSSSSLPFSTYLSIPNKDLVYNPVDALLYISVPSSAGATLGNSVVSVDPATGVIGTPIWVGSEPGKLALSDDGTALWVALDGASSVRKVSLTLHAATNVQFYLRGDSHTGLGSVTDLAVLPGSPNSVAVAYSGVVSVWDGTVKRTNTGGGLYSNGYLAFGTSASKLYAAGSNYAIYTVDGTGIASTSSTATSSYTNALRFDSGRVYLTSGAVLDANTGTLVGTFASSGPVAPDSTVNRAFVLNGSGGFGSYDRITAFDIGTFVSTGTTAVAGISSSITPTALVRWGQDGLAFRTDSQLFIIRSSLVRDLSATKADVGVVVAAPSAATTGSNINYNLTISNSGPNPATNVVLIDTLPDSVIFTSVTPSQGSCSAGNVVRCNLGSIASGGNATVQVAVTPTTSGSVTAHATVSAMEADPNMANNNADAVATVTGSAYNPLPLMISISPSLVKAGSGTTTVTVTGRGFTPSSVVRWNNTGLSTQFVDATTLTATLDSSYLSSMGWGFVTVATSAPGGGTSLLGLPLTIYASVPLDTNSVVFDPFTRKIWASVPSTATQVTGNSLVAIDPETATAGIPINIGSEPKRVALSDDGQYLYTVLSGSKEVRRMNLPTLTPGARFTTTDYWNAAFSADDVSVMPGNHDAVATSGYSSAIQVWDVSGSGATKRANAGFVYAGVFLNWTDNSHLFSYDSGLSPSKLHRFSVGASSATEVDATNVTWFSGRFTPYQQTPASKVLLYSDGGGVVDPSPVSPNPPQLVGRYGSSGSLALESGAQRVFIMNTNSYYTSGSPTISAFHQYSFQQRGAVPLQLNSGDAVSDLIRWGQDGLAFRKYQGAYGPATAGTGEIILMRGPFVVPQVAMNNPQPTATLLSPSSIAAGSSNTYVTVTGSGFVPGAVVLWNGQPRTTTFIDGPGTSLKVAIPASDLAAPGTASVTVVNPNSVASSAITFTVN